MPAMNDAFIPEMFERVNKRLRAMEEQLGAGFEEANEIVTGI